MQRGEFVVQKRPQPSPDLERGGRDAVQMSASERFSNRQERFDQRQIEPLSAPLPRYFHCCGGPVRCIKSFTALGDIQCSRQQRDIRAALAKNLNYIRRVPIPRYGGIEKRPHLNQERSAGTDIR